MRQFVVLVICQCLAFTVSSQPEIDSLKSLVNSKIRKGEVESVANYFGQIGLAFLSRGLYDSATYYYYKSLGTSTTDRKLAASNFNALGVIYNNKGFADSAVSYYNKALAFYIQDQDTTNSTIIQNNLGIIYKNQGLYEKALENVFSALEQLERLPPDRPLASAYNSAGSVYARMGDHQNALIYYKKSLMIRQKIGYKKGVGQSYNNIGECFIGMKMYDSALFYLMKSNLIKKDLSDEQGMGATMNLIGVVLIKQKRYAEAMPYLTQSAKIKKASGERLDEAIALNNLAELSIATKDYLIAGRYLQRADTLIRKSAALDQLQRNLELTVQLYKARNDVQQALKAVEELLTVKDSLLTKDKVESLYTMQVRYETDKKEQHITLLERERELQESELESNAIWIWSLTMTVFLLIIIAVLIYLNFRTARKGKQDVEMLLKEMHHRVKNNLQLLTSIFSLHSQELTDVKAIQAVRSSEARINAMALIHRKLYNVDHNRTINISDYLAELMQYLTSAYNHHDRKFNISTTLEGVSIDVDKAIPLGLIMNELISNSFKYAFDGHPDPLLKISISAINGSLHVTVSDNGKGLDGTKLAESDSFGLKMIGALMKQLRGTMEISTDAGTHYLLKIPL